MARSDDKKDFTTLGIGGGSDPSTDDVAPDDIDTFGTLGLGAIPLKGARRADKPESDKGDEGEKPAPAPTPQSDRIQELRRQRNAQIQAFLAQAESALAEDRLEESRAAIEQAVLLSPDNSRVMSMLEAVEQAEQARLEAERARHRAEEARRKAEQARAILTKPAGQATPRAGGPVRGDSAASEGVDASGAAGLLFASGADQARISHQGIKEETGIWYQGGKEERIRQIGRQEEDRVVGNGRTDQPRTRSPVGLNRPGFVRELVS